MSEVVSSTLETQPIPMDAETLTALRGSIKKWQDIVNGDGEDEGEVNCPLCRKFPDANCTGCPVKAKTGLTGCRGTPYTEEWCDFETDNAETEEEIAAARSMLNFLISLLPPGEKP